MAQTEAAQTAAAALPEAPPPRASGLIGEVVVELGYADRDAVDRAVALAREQGRQTGEVLLESGAITPDQLAEALALRFGVDHVALSTFPVDMAAANLVSLSAAKRLEAVPVGFVGEATLVVAMRDPANVLAIDGIARLTGYNIRPAVATPEDIQALTSRLDRVEAVDAPVVKLVDSLIAQAVELGASDIHFEPRDGGLDVRLRVDGVMVDTTRVPTELVAGVVSRLKIMANVDVGEGRRSEDGRIGMDVDGRRVDVRAVVLPLVGGESVVLRVLDQATVPMNLDEVGFGDLDRARLDDALVRSHGAVLATGPAGSGKSTTLYAALMAINQRERTIVTIEDPVEYRLEGVKQIQIDEKAGVTFAAGLRTIMRADPDTIMVGEIRDGEIAMIGIEAAIAGHLVLSTLHTDDAPTAVTRLVEMGIEPYLVASSINCVVGQRLARRLCDSCAQAAAIPATILEAGAEGEVEVREPGGCARCGGTGYRGRIGLFEVMPVTQAVRDAVLRRGSAEDIAAVAVEEGMRRLREDGMAKVAAGITSLAEVTRVTGR